MPAAALRSIMTDNQVGTPFSLSGKWLLCIPSAPCPHPAPAAPNAFCGAGWGKGRRDTSPGGSKTLDKCPGSVAGRAWPQSLTPHPCSAWVAWFLRSQTCSEALPESSLSCQSWMRAGTEHNQSPDSISRDTEGRAGFLAT